MAQQYIAADEMSQRQNHVVLAKYAKAAGQNA